ncbi:DUF4136 domain-containing protein [Undibacterium sp. RTI2.1]|uniref:DUF4136 domain-containing protein n=1 Tax=unclassified Undibacterium TaxID=2630295 RepID=UPI002AB52588|nr:MULTISPECIES: DUF4136 domain-containing protein [unclassified Undibacterium]MDY7536763.1 DUF4136 domain-containing protein [Undibacterium sp. 5I1]MEB0029571.1 DUF4136 domain-containing protein [Undibacterium sp. RTI2.1]MEB0115758.1 DUF4136 domain-containing protein [Undibacterium sp. RTI2.2]MEB0232939.1 DUF4136 domain-containing protein [Undibacterium sp. 10I3]MEB0256645.1 DUF4136 domain-containing protein [Undibacterium sp. 5I1]
MKTGRTSPIRKSLLLLLATTSLLLAGCATSVTSRVSVFQEWPADIKDKSYVIERTEPQQNSPEYNSYEQLLRNKLQTLGFAEAGSEANAALKISMQYGTGLSEIQFSAPWDLALYDPFWGSHFRRGLIPRAYYYRYPYSYSPYYFGRTDSMLMSDLSVRRYYLHQLEIGIADKVSGKKLYEIKASTEQLSPEINLQMPYLIDSAFIDFPAKTGSTMEIELPIMK